MFDKNVIAISNDATILEKKIIGKSMDPNYKVKVYYPYTPYAILNSTIEDKVTKEVTSLIDTSKENMIQPNQFYTLNINYEQYSYRDYISYVFFISVYTGGAHPNNTIWTITFDKVNSKFITIEDLVNNYPNILNTLSIETRKILKKDKRFENDQDIIDMLNNGTSPNEDNFKSFAFSEDGLLIYFEQYQVAPYSFGDFEITVPYNQVFQ